LGGSRVPALFQARFFHSTPIETIEPTSISEINEAANNFGSPAEKAIQPTVARQVKTTAKNPVHPSAAIHAQPIPRSIRNPHAADKIPKVPPEISAVFAPEGFDKNPATPQRIKNSPNPTNQHPENFIGRHLSTHFVNEASDSQEDRFA
jgi:hypothetical protein